MKGQNKMRSNQEIMDKVNDSFDEMKRNVKRMVHGQKQKNSEN